MAIFLTVFPLPKEQSVCAAKHGSQADCFNSAVTKEET